MTTEHDRGVVEAEAREGISTKVTDFLAAQAMAAEERKAQIANSSPLTPEQQLGLLEEQTFTPIPYQTDPLTMAHITDPALIQRAVESAEHAGDMEWSKAWKQRQHELNVAADTEVYSPEALEQVHAAADLYRANVRARELGLQGIAGEAELNRRAAQVNEILTSNGERRFDHIADLDSAIDHTRNQIANAEHQGYSFSKEQTEAELSRLVQRRGGISQIQDARFEQVHDPGELRAEALQSIAEKAAQAWDASQS